MFCLSVCIGRQCKSNDHKIFWFGGTHENFGHDHCKNTLFMYIDKELVACKRNSSGTL